MATWRLPRLIGMGHARHLILSGENIDPQEAFRMGLVNKVVDRSRLVEELQAWEQRYREVPTNTLKWVKRLTNQALDLPFEGFLREMDEAMGVVLASEEHLAARQAWRERKKRPRPDEKRD
jgi:enoyl-CoA hydratase/carnithine racemase